MANVYRLYIFETLVREGGSMAVNSLWSCISSRFSENAEFVQIIGKNINDFEIFLRSNSALFNLDGFTVSLADDDTNDYYLPEKSAVRYRFQYRDLRDKDINYEQEAVKYFKTILLKKPGVMMPIRSLVSYLAQAPMQIRIGLGTKNELISFLYRYPRVFKITGEQVTLTEDAVNTVMMLQTQVQLRNKKRASIGLKERSNSMRIPMSSMNHFRLSTVYNDQIPDLNLIQTSLSSTPAGRPLSTMIERTPLIEPVINAYTGKKNNIISLSISEFKTISWLRCMIFSLKDSVVPVSQVMRRLIEAPEIVHSTLGMTQVEFVEFLNKHPALATVENDLVQFKPTKRLHLIIVENQPQDINNGVNLNGKKGCVFCVSKLWGIIDLGYHEHVFFDRSLFKNVTDLQKHFKVGELLYFNAVLAAKESRAKWRATRVWKESDILATRLAIKNNPNANSKLNTFTDSFMESGCLLAAGKRTSNMLIDALVLKQSPEISSSLAIDGLNLVECISSYASVRLAAPWEVSAIIAQSSEIFSEPLTPPSTSLHNGGSNKLFLADIHRKPLMEVHSINRNSKSGQTVSGLGTLTSSSDNSSPERGCSSSDAKDLSKLLLKMNIDAEPVVPTDWLRRSKNNSDNDNNNKKPSKGQLLMCAEQGSQTENYQIITKG